MLFHNYKQLELETCTLKTIWLPKPLEANEFYKIFSILNENPLIYGVVYYPDIESTIPKTDIEG